MTTDALAQRFVAQSAALVFPLFAMLGLELMGAETEAALAYQRAAVAQGEWWRFFTGNFVHFTLHHTLINVLGLAMTGFLLFRDQPPKMWWTGLILLPLVVTGGLHVFDNGLSEYRGFSGALYGMLILGLLLGRKQQPGLYVLMIAVLTGKIIYEQLPYYDANYLMEEIGVPVAANAHLYGLSGGIVIFGVFTAVTGWCASRGRSP